MINEQRARDRNFIGERLMAMSRGVDSYRTLGTPDASHPALSADERRRYQRLMVIVQVATGEFCRLGMNIFGSDVPVSPLSQEQIELFNEIAPVVLPGSPARPSDTAAGDERRT